MAALFATGLEQATLLFRWWFGELVGMIPERIRERFRSDRAALVIDIDDNVVRLQHGNARSMQPIGDIEARPGEDALARRRFDELVSDGRVKFESQVVRVADRHALRKVLDLPLAAADNLDELLNYELDRFTPFERDDVYYDWTVLQRNRATQRVAVGLVVVPRPIVDAAVSRARALGVVPDRVTVMGTDAMLSAINLLPREKAPARSRLATRVSLALGGLLFALIAALIALPLHQRQAELDDLREQVTKARAEAAAVGKLRQEIDDLTQHNRYVLDRKIEQPLFIDILNEVSRLLPDNSWLNRLRYSQGEVQLFGFSPTSSALIGTIDESKMFRDVRFLAPVTKDVRLDADRFNIGCQIDKDWRQ